MYKFTFMSHDTTRNLASITAHSTGHDVLWASFMPTPWGDVFPSDTENSVNLLYCSTCSLFWTGLLHRVPINPGTVQFSIMPLVVWNYFPSLETDLLSFQIHLSGGRIDRALSWKDVRRRRSHPKTKCCKPRGEHMFVTRFSCCSKIDSSFVVSFTSQWWWIGGSVFLELRGSSVWTVWHPLRWGWNRREVMLSFWNYGGHPF